MTVGLKFGIPTNEIPSIINEVIGHWLITRIEYSETMSLIILLQNIK